MRVSPKSSLSRYSEEFRSDALNLIRRGDRSVRQLGADLGVSPWTLREWRKKDLMAAKNKKPKAAAPSESTGSNETAEQKLARLEGENRRLLRENEQLRMDREILKKAAAFFAKESE